MIRKHFLAVLALVGSFALTPSAAGTLQTPEQFVGHKVGADNKLIRWDKIVDYMKLAAANSDRVRYRELGKSSNNNPFIVLEISAPETLKNLDRYKEMERKLYFQGGAPTDAERDAIFTQGKVVVVITCSIHATEIGATQMSVELVHRLATEDSPKVKKILDNVIFLLVPSLNPDGEIMVTDWFNKNVGIRSSRARSRICITPTSATTTTATSTCSRRKRASTRRSCNTETDIAVLSIIIDSMR